MARHFDIIFTDLDGTLLTSEKKVSHCTLELFRTLKERGVVRVIVTGRSCFSLRKIIDEDFPVDYLIFSSGAGIINVTTNELLFCRPLMSPQIQTISRQLIAHGLDFMVHEQVPENHRFRYHQHRADNADFNRRVSIYRDYCQPFTHISELPEYSAQIIAVLPGDLALFTTIAASLDDVQITRTTSPLDHQSIWMEIYPPGVSKGSAAKWLCDHLNLCQSRTMGIGNDYNDIDLLDFVSLSYVVANAPQCLLEKYRQTSSNDKHGVYHAIMKAS